MSFITPRKFWMPTLLALAIAPLSFIATAAPGDEKSQGNDAHKPHEQRFEAMADQWDLSEEERNALHDARQDYRDQREALREDYRQTMIDILGEERVDEMHDHKRDIHEKRHKAHRDFMQQRLDALYDSWELSEDDRQALDDAHEAMRERARELHDQAFDNREDKHDAWLAIRDEHRDALADVLNDTQLEALKVIMKPPHGKGPHGGKPHHESDL